MSWIGHGARRVQPLELPSQANQNDSRVNPALGSGKAFPRCLRRSKGWRRPGSDPPNITRRKDGKFHPPTIPLWARFFSKAPQQTKKHPGPMIVTGSSLHKRMVHDTLSAALSLSAFQLLDLDKCCDRAKVVREACILEHWHVFILGCSTKFSSWGDMWRLEFRL